MPERKRLLIVGGVAGGASAAARARRLSETAEIVMFERGEHISFANCGLPYHVGGAIAERSRLLVQTPEAMRRRFRIDVRTRTEVMSIDRERREVVARDLETGADHNERYDALILSPGAAPFVPPIPGAESERVFTLRNIPDMDAIKRLVDESAPKRAVVVGGGFVGLEMVEALRERGLDVTIVELLPQVMAPVDPEIAALVHQQLALHGVEIRLGTSVGSFTETDSGLDIRLSTGETLKADLAILAVGVRPESKLAREAGLDLGESGGIKVDEHMRTSDPAIWAVGDAVETEHLVGGFSRITPLAGPANRQGRIAADNVFGRDSTYKKTQGTAICKVFDLAVAGTGLNEKDLKKAGIAYEKVFVHPACHAGYYPGATPLTIKLLFSPSDGKLLGGQVAGVSGADKRIDVLAVAIRAGMTVYDLEDLELAYAPPYGSAKDPVNYAGFVAANALRGDVGLCHVEDVADPKADQFLLDVRTPPEFAAGTIPGAANIPLDELRDRLEEIPKDKELLVFCQVGLRGYLACRILAQHDCRCRNLTGGYKTWSAATGGCPAPVREQMTSDTGVESAACAQPERGSVQPVKRKIVKEIDATGLQCPGPIMQLARAIDDAKPGDMVKISASDPGFATDGPAWAHSTGHELVDLTNVGGIVTAVIAKGDNAKGGPAPAAGHAAAPTAGAVSTKKKTIVVFSNDLDRAMAAFIIANGAAAMGSDVTLFFTFWGLNLLRRHKKVRVKKTLMERMFGWMMPRGARRVILSKMHMGGMGTRMMKGVMRKKNVASLPELIESAIAAGVKLVACTMTMGIMGIKPEELIDGVDEGGVAMYLDNAERGSVNLFI